jgi:hypothetical protein
VEGGWLKGEASHFLPLGVVWNKFSDSISFPLQLGKQPKKFSRNVFSSVRDILNLLNVKSNLGAWGGVVVKALRY